MHMIGEDVSEQLDVIPAVLRVKRVRRPRYGCRSCEGAVVQAKAPSRLVDNGMATTALVTSIVVGKFAWHLPLNRQTHMFRGLGIELDRSTLVHWVLRAAWWLRPLYMLLHRRSSVTIRRCRYWIAGDDEHERRGSGPTQSMIGHGKDLQCRSWSTFLRKIAKGNMFMSI